MAKRARRPEARPDEILDAALAVFSAKGFAGARVADIAARAGISKGAVYLYFDSKHEMLKALVRRLADRVMGKAELVIDTEHGDAERTLRTILAFLAAQLADPRVAAAPRLIIAEAQRFPEIAAFYRDTVLVRGQKLLARVIDLGVAQGVFRDVDRAVAMRCCGGPMLAHMMLSTVFADPKTPAPSAEVIGAGIADMILNGLKKKNGALP